MSIQTDDFAPSRRVVSAAPASPNEEAIERALRQNLAGLLSEYNTIEARGEKWEQLSELLPNVNGTVQENVQEQSLEALGLRKFRGRVLS